MLYGKEKEAAGRHFDLDRKKKTYLKPVLVKN